MARHSSKTTTNHSEIKRWAEARGATPACVKGTGSRSDPGMIRLDFPGYSGSDSLEPITWDEWFESFDDNGLALVYQDKTASGKRSNFNKIIGRDTAEKRAHGDNKASRHHGSTRRSTSSRSRSGSSTRSRSSSARSSSSHKSRTRSTPASMRKTTRRRSSTARAKK